MEDAGHRTGKKKEYFMTKDVIVAIQGLQTPANEEAERVELITAADYYKRNNKHYIIYDEVMEGFEETTRNVIKACGDCVEITKKGVSNVHMVFEKNKKNMTYYHTPFGNILIGIEAERIEISEEEEQMLVCVDYALEVNYEHLADCAIQVKVTAKEAGSFRI